MIKQPAAHRIARRVLRRILRSRRNLFHRNGIDCTPRQGRVPRVATIFPNCYRTRRGFHLRRLQVTLSAAKLEKFAEKHADSRNVPSN